MSETPNPFDLLIDQIRAVVREEMKAAMNGNGHGKLLTAEELADKLQVHPATIYEKVKAKNSVLSSRALCTVQFTGSFREPKK